MGICRRDIATLLSPRLNASSEAEDPFDSSAISHRTTSLRTHDCKLMAKRKLPGNVSRCDSASSFQDVVADNVPLQSESPTFERTLPSLRQVGAFERFFA